MEINCTPLYLSALTPQDKTKFLYFSEFTVYSNVNLPCCYNPSIFSIDGVNAQPIITCCSIINTMEGKSLEGQRLSGKKLIINGYFKVKIVTNYFNKLSVLNEIIPFSTYIIIPMEICSKNIILKYLIEDTTAEIIEKNKLLISVSSLFLFSDENINVSIDNKDCR